jgi:hypothetical protein
LLLLWLFGPLAILLGGVALLHRRRVLGLWRSGCAIEAAVIESHQAPASPLSRLLTCAPLDERYADALKKVTLPAKIAHARPGDLLWLIVADPVSTRALAAAAFTASASA